jgi:hypothetical protein
MMNRVDVIVAAQGADVGVFAHGDPAVVEAFSQLRSVVYLSGAPAAVLHLNVPVERSKPSFIVLYDQDTEATPIPSCNRFHEDES